MYRDRHYAGNNIVGLGKSNLRRIFVSDSLKAEYEESALYIYINNVEELNYFEISNTGINCRMYAIYPKIDYVAKSIFLERPSNKTLNIVIVNAANLHSNTVVSLNLCVIAMA